MTTDPVWQCRLCHARYPDEWERDECEAEHYIDDTEDCD